MGEFDGKRLTGSTTGKQQMVDGGWVQATQVYQQSVALPVGVSLELGVSHSGSIFDPPCDVANGRLT